VTQCDGESAFPFSRWATDKIGDAVVDDDDGRVTSAGPFWAKSNVWSASSSSKLPEVEST
jgi:hypothetical protein